MGNERFCFRVTISFMCPDCGKPHERVTGAEFSDEDPKAIRAMAQTVRLLCDETNQPVKSVDVDRAVGFERITALELAAIDPRRRFHIPSTPDRIQ